MFSWKGSAEAGCWLLRPTSRPAAASRTTRIVTRDLRRIETSHSLKFRQLRKRGCGMLGAMAAGAPVGVPCHAGAGCLTLIGESQP